MGHVLASLTFNLTTIITSICIVGIFTWLDVAFLGKRILSCLAKYTGLCAACLTQSNFMLAIIVGFVWLYLFNWISDNLGDKDD